MRPAPKLPIFLLALLAPAAAAGENKEHALERVEIFDASRAEEPSPRGQGVQVGPLVDATHRAVELRVEGGTAWARAWFSSVPADLRSFARLEIAMRAVSGSPAPLFLRLHDRSENVASVRIDAPKAEWETREVPIGDVLPEAGFDPTALKALTLVWFKPAGHSLAVSRVSLVTGQGGWRHPPEELVRRVFGPRRAGEVKHVATAHFDVYSDSAKALGSGGLPESLEADLRAAASVLHVTEEETSRFRLPVYAFKSAKEFREYGERALGWTEDEARRSSATGSYWALVLLYKGGDPAEVTRRIAKSLLQHVHGPGGGAWLQEGVGELCARSPKKSDPTREILPRLKAGPLWGFAELLVAERLHAGADRLDATFDHRPIYAHAASVVEFVLDPSAWPAAEGKTPGDSVRERLAALASIRTNGKARLAEISRTVGMDIPALERAWRDWVTRTRD